MCLSLSLWLVGVLSEGHVLFCLLLQLLNETYLSPASCHSNIFHALWSWWATLSSDLPYASLVSQPFR